jgi:hypothetical protein
MAVIFEADGPARARATARPGAADQRAGACSTRSGWRRLDRRQRRRAGEAPGAGHLRGVPDAGAAVGAEADVRLAVLALRRPAVLSHADDTHDWRTRMAAVIEEQLEAGDRPAYRIWSRIGDQAMTAREVDAAIGRIAGLAHTREGELVDCAAAEALRILSVENGTLIQTRDAAGTLTYRRADEFVPSPAFGSPEYNCRQQQRADAIEANRLRMIDEASQSAYDHSPLAMQKREDEAFFRKLVREDGPELLREAIREQARAAVLELLGDVDRREEARAAVLELLGEIDRPMAVRLRAQLEEREHRRDAD